MPVMPRARSGNSEARTIFLRKAALSRRLQGFVRYGLALPELWRLLRLFQNLAALLAGIRRGASAHPGEIRRRRRQRHGLQRRSLPPLQGEVGKATACAIYAIRPDVCRACPRRPRMQRRQAPPWARCPGVVPASTGKT